MNKIFDMATRIGQRMNDAAFRLCGGHGARLAGLSSGLLAGLGEAQAHVKWFAPYDVAAAPASIGAVLTPVFWASMLLSALVILALYMIERQWLGNFAHQVLDDLTSGIRRRSDDIMRAGSAAFFVGLWTLGGVYLTPELKTNAEWIPWLQAAIAASFFSRVTMPLGGLGIFALWALAMRDYGLFHMMDYPIFLGLGIYMMLFYFDGKPLFELRLTVLRCAAAITLMWASIEKFAYPNWTAPVVHAKPYLAAGFDFDTFMTLAGVVEFGLAFAMLCSPLARRLGALVLGILFIAAVFPFGKIDALGHLVIILILSVVFAEKRSESVAIEAPNWRRVLAVNYSVLTIVFGAYYASHSMMFGHDHSGPALEKVSIIQQARAEESAPLEKLALR